MASINYATREISCKIVYYGPGLSGKTTNLQIIHRKIPDKDKSEMVSLATETDRTLFFDFLPLDLGSIKGFATKFQLYTVPGQVYYNATRKLVLRGVDGVVFVVDSQADKLQENLESFQNLQENLREYGHSIETIPVVLQFNKRDLPNVYSIEQLNSLLNKYGMPYFEAVASTGVGVFTTLKGIGKSVIDKFNAKYSGFQGSRRPAGSPATGAIPTPPRPAPPAAPAPRMPASPAPLSQTPGGFPPAPPVSPFQTPSSNPFQGKPAGGFTPPPSPFGHQAPSGFPPPPSPAPPSPSPFASAPGGGNPFGGAFGHPSPPNPVQQPGPGMNPPGGTGFGSPNPAGPGGQRPFAPPPPQPSPFGGPPANPNPFGGGHIPVAPQVEGFGQGPGPMAPKPPSPFGAPPAAPMGNSPFGNPPPNPMGQMPGKPQQPGFAPQPPMATPSPFGAPGPASGGFAPPGPNKDFGRDVGESYPGMGNLGNMPPPSSSPFGGLPPMPSPGPNPNRDQQGQPPPAYGNPGGFHPGLGGGPSPMPPLGAPGRGGADNHGGIVSTYEDMQRDDSFKTRKLPLPSEKKKGFFDGLFKKDK